MATVTFSTAESTFQPPVCHTGVNFIFGYKASCTCTGADGLLLARVPHGATIIDGIIQGTTAGSLTDVQVGTSASAQCLLVTASGAAYQRFFNGSVGATPIGYFCSAPNSATDQTVLIKAIATASFSGAYRFMIAYTMGMPG